MALRETLVVKMSGKMARHIRELAPQIKEAKKRMNVILVHGGQEQLTSLMQKLDRKVEFVNGRRVTDRETLDLAKMAFGKINYDFVETLENEGVEAVGISGLDARCLTGKAAGERGLEGDVEKVQLNLFRELMEKHVLVVSPLIYDPEKKTSLNADADDISTSIARALGAKMMILGDGMKGVIGADGKIINRISTRDIGRLIQEKTVSGGMIPKIQACIDARLPKVWILDGTEKNVILRALRGEKIGTMIAGG